MPRPWFGAVLALAFVSVAVPAQACHVERSLEVRDAKYADIVVIGRIVNYRIEAPTARLPEHARFDVEIDEVWKGKAAKTVPVVWDKTFPGADKIGRTPYLIALRSPQSDLPPLPGTLTIFPSPSYGDAFLLMQGYCTDPFIFDGGGQMAWLVRRMLLGVEPFPSPKFDK